MHIYWGGKEGHMFIFEWYQIKPVNIQHGISVSSPWRLSKIHSVCPYLRATLPCDMDPTLQGEMISSNRWS